MIANIRVGLFIDAELAPIRKISAKKQYVVANGRVKGFFEDTCRIALDSKLMIRAGKLKDKSMNIRMLTIRQLTLRKTPPNTTGHLM